MKQTIVKFFEPLNKKYRFLTVSASVIIGIALYVGVDIGLAEVVRQNTYDIHMLASELLIELGPDFTSETGRHAEMIKQYTDQLEQRHLATILRVLYPTYSPRKVLAYTLSGLEKAAKDKKEEESKKAILEAGLASNQLYMRGMRFPRSPIVWFDSEDLPDQLLMDLDKALAESHELVDKLEKDRTPEAAIESCRANRKAILLLFLSRLGHDNEEKIKRFQSEVEQARDCTRLLARTEKDKKKQKWLYEVAESEDRRVKILDAMLANDMDRVCDLLREAIEIAFEKEKGSATE